MSLSSVLCRTRHGGGFWAVKCYGWMHAAHHNNKVF